MWFTHDPEHDFFYLGEEEPGPGFFREKMSGAPKLIGVDTETISLRERIAIGIGIALSPTCAFYFPLFPQPSPITPWHLLRDPTITKSIHNALFDLVVLREYEVDNTNMYDTTSMAHLLCYPSAVLADLNPIHELEVQPVKELLAEHNARMMLEIPQEVVARKCMRDAMASLKLSQIWLPKLDMPYFLTEMQLIPILMKMSYRGIALDQEVRGVLEVRLSEEVEYYRKLCEDVDGFNPGATQQVGYVLAKRGAYNVFTRLPFTRGRSLSTAVETLERMDDPLANVVLNYRRKAALLKNYILPWKGEDRAYCRWHLEAACYDDQTEVLTRSGWKLFRDLTYQDSIATLNPDTWYMEYQQPTDIIAVSYRGNMHSIETRQLSLLVTPEHHMYVGQKHPSHEHVGAGRENFIWSIRTASDIYHKSTGFIHKKDALWQGVEREHITIGNKTIPMDEWLMFFGLWIAEGYTTSRQGRHDNSIGIRHTDVNLLWGEMNWLLVKWGITAWRTSDLSRLAFTDPDLKPYLAKLGKANDKYIPREYMELSSRQLGILLEYYLKGDGNLRLKGSGRVRRTAYTSSTKLRDDLQEIALKTGCAANYNLHSGRPGDVRIFTGEQRAYRVNYQNYVVSFVEESCLTVVNGRFYPKTEKYVEYDGMVYCAAVPNHIMYVRRHGKPVWCGNTGRPSSTDRNLQNIPQGEARNIFLPDNGMWSDTDFSQLELRVLAYLSGDREMQYIFSLPKLNPDGTPNEEADIHQQSANFLGIRRRIAKNVNFSFIYGGTDETIAETAGIRDVRRAAQLKAMWFQKFPQAADWIQSVQGQAIEYPYATTLYGRRLRLPTVEEESIDGIGRKAVNYPVQASAAEILKRGLIQCKELDLALTVHDSILVDGYIPEERMKQLEDIAPLHTPVEVKYLSRWE